ncbi:hypothetical protein Bbelb_116170 [Branchiostoma belcheri]|nr:hypothetical protein Bbelb_116170 [Branchiostoma belcheri]
MKVPPSKLSVSLGSQGMSKAAGGVPPYVCVCLDTTTGSNLQTLTNGVPGMLDEGYYVTPGTGQVLYVERTTVEGSSVTETTTLAPEEADSGVVKRHFVGPAADGRQGHVHEG